MDFFRPDALQICREAARPRRAYQEVTAKIEIQRRQTGIARVPLGHSNSLRCRFACCGCIARLKVKRDPLEVLAIVRNVRLAKRLVGLLGCFIQINPGCSRRIFGLTTGEALVIRAPRDQQNNLVGFLHAQSVFTNRSFAAAIQNADASGISNASSAQAVVQLADHQQTVLTIAHGLKSFWAVQPRFKRNLFGTVRAQTQNHYLIRRARKHLSRELDACAFEFNVRGGLVEIQFATIVLNRCPGVARKG